MIQPGQTTAIIDIAIDDDDIAENEESFLVMFHTGAGANIEHAATIVTIIDDD